MRILDLTAGKRAIWFNKNHPLATYVDIRPEVKPDIVANLCELKDFADNTFDLVVFDPPHLNTGKNSIFAKSYGHFTTEQILKIICGAAKEAHRVTISNALMALKWNDHDIKLQRVFNLMPQWEPLFGHLTKDGPGSKTYWAMLRRMT